MNTTLEILTIEEIFGKIQAGDFLASFPNYTEQQLITSAIRALDDIPHTRLQYIEAKHKAISQAKADYRALMEEADVERINLLSSLFSFLFDALETEAIEKGKEWKESIFWKAVTLNGNGYTIESLESIANCFVYFII